MHFFPPLFLQHYNSAMQTSHEYAADERGGRNCSLKCILPKTPWYPFARQKLKPIQQLLSMLMHSPRDVL